MEQRIPLQRPSTDRRDAPAPAGAVVPGARGSLEGGLLAGILSKVAEFVRSDASPAKPERARVGLSDRQPVDRGVMMQVGTYPGLGSAQAREAGFSASQDRLAALAVEYSQTWATNKARGLHLSLLAAQELVDQADPGDRRRLDEARAAAESVGLVVPEAAQRDKAALSSFIAGANHAAAALSTPGDFWGRITGHAPPIEGGSPLGKGRERDLHAASSKLGLTPQEYTQAGLGSPEAGIEFLDAAQEVGLDPEMARLVMKAYLGEGETSALVNRAAAYPALTHLPEISRPVQRGPMPVGEYLRMGQKEPSCRIFLDQAARSLRAGTAHDPAVQVELKAAFDQVERYFPKFAGTCRLRGQDPDSLAKRTIQWGGAQNSLEALKRRAAVMSVGIPDAEGFVPVRAGGAAESGLVAVAGAPMRLIQLSVDPGKSPDDQVVRVLEDQRDGSVSESYRGPAAGVPDSALRDIAVVASTYYENFPIKVQVLPLGALVPLESALPRPAGFTQPTSTSLLALLRAVPLGSHSISAADASVVAA